MESPWLLPGETEQRRCGYLERLVEAVEGQKLHVLRHAFASELSRHGVAYHVVSRLLVHSIGGGMTARYIHEGKESREAMEKLWEEPAEQGEKKKRRKGDK